MGFEFGFMKEGFLMLLIVKLKDVHVGKQGGTNVRLDMYWDSVEVWAVQVKIVIPVLQMGVELVMFAISEGINNWVFPFVGTLLLN